MAELTYTAVGATRGVAPQGFRAIAPLLPEICTRRYLRVLRD